MGIDQILLARPPQVRIAALRRDNVRGSGRSSGGAWL